MFHFSQPITTLIEKRTSWRTYSSEKFDQPLEAAIQNLLNSPISSNPFPSSTRLKLFEMADTQIGENKKYGTYGFISGARYFVIGAIPKETNAWEYFGYHLESLMLKFTEMGLGTCWLGGTFSRTAFADIMDLTPNEILPAITPLGFPKDRRLKEKLIRTVVGAKRRKPWSQLFFNEDGITPIDADSLSKYTIPLEMVRLGPSASNRQSWRIINISSSPIFHFYTAGPSVNKSDAYKYMRKLDIGIATAHFDLSAKELGLTGQWKFNNPKLELPEGFTYVISWHGNS